MSKRKIYSAIDAAAMVRRRRAHLPVQRRELCEYVTDLTLALHDVTSSSKDMKFLSYLLAIVVEEAAHQAERAADAELSLETPTNAEQVQD